MTADNINMTDEGATFILGLDEIKDISLLTPVYFEFGKTKEYISSWKMLYMQVVRRLAKDYYLKIASWAGMGDVYKTGMNMNGKSCSYIEGALYLNTDIPDKVIINKIIKFMHICDENEKLLKLCCRLTKESNLKNTSDNQSLIIKSLKNTSDNQSLIFKNLKNKCEERITKIANEVKIALEITDDDEAVAKFTECRSSVMSERNKIKDLNLIEEKFKNNSIWNNYFVSDVKNTNLLIEKFENLISEEKNKSLITLEMDDWNEAEKAFNTSRENIRVVRSAISLIKELDLKNEQSDV